MVTAVEKEEEADGPEFGQANETPDDIASDKQARLEKERNALLSSLAGADYSALKTKVATILNLYPHTRDSDVALALKFWETFQPDVYNPSGILPKDLFRLERVPNIVRARAKIQNEYGLFQADEKIRKTRKYREEEIKEAVIEDAPPRQIVHVFSDETGKTDSYVIVASVWVLVGHTVYSLTEAIRRWKEKSIWAKREIHFSRFGKADPAPLSEYLKIVKDNREYLSFKVIAVERARTRRSIEEIVAKLHEQLLIRGAFHEVSSGRIALPREIEVSIDEEQSLDSFALADLKQSIAHSYRQRHDGALQLTAVRTASSKNSPLIQLVDLIAGAMNRRLNHKGERGVKDDMADMVIEALDLALHQETLNDLDATVLFRV